MIWTVAVAKPVQKAVVRFPAKDQAKIEDAFRAIAGSPFSGDIIKLTGENNRWRRRVGNYRIFFRVDVAAKKVDISAVTRRTSATY